jgi:hypothetical protein
MNAAGSREQVTRGYQTVSRAWRLDPVGTCPMQPRSRLNALGARRWKRISSPQGGAIVGRSGPLWAKYILRVIRVRTGMR